MVGYAGSGSRAPAPSQTRKHAYRGGVGVGSGSEGGTPRGTAASPGAKVRVNSTAPAPRKAADCTAGERKRAAEIPRAGAGQAAGRTKSEFMKTCVSPWERAMKGKAELVATLKPHMPGPETPHELQKYKSFNRSAMPYGGFEKASQLMTFQLPEMAKKVVLEPTIVYPHDINSRPSFNRTPIGWIGSGETSHIHVEMENVPFDAETEEL
ncbi:hypothetical protein ANANG_G00305160 [Anguilla anguilla]|uniref:Myozenin-1 n=1 Tax=Anguilla anguilla TaxID=7936 RepID=A0A9D3LIQ2_ANGAN|nr:hypothetical protein ANANG_G00305160 [Anguilla anguilla]